MSATTSLWHGGPAGPAALRQGREIVARLTPCGRMIERIWVDIARVTGTIVECGDRAAEIDAGPHRGRYRLVFSSQSWEKVRVRHPRLEPGRPADVIGIRSYDGTCVVASTPATAQPEYVGTRLSTRPHGGPLPAAFEGTVTWFDAFGDDPAAGTRGAAYPLLDPAGDGADCPEPGPGCAGLPYLSLGSVLRVRNDCDDQERDLPVVACGCVSTRFCDRCVECGASARGRVAELTPLSFVDLGGDLAAGCFNATVAVG